MTGAAPAQEAAVLVDARGLRCPWPVLRLARAAREHPPGTRIRLIADDPAAPREIAALAEERGWTIERPAADRENADAETIIVLP